VYTKIRQVDCYSTLYDLLIVLICGDISIQKTHARRFAQQIVLAPQGPLKYYVVNDIFRYIDEGEDHVENEMETESSSEGPEEDLNHQVQPAELQQHSKMAPQDQVHHQMLDPTDMMRENMLPGADGVTLDLNANNLHGPQDPSADIGEGIVPNGIQGPAMVPGQAGVEPTGLNNYGNMTGSHLETVDTSGIAVQNNFMDQKVKVESSEELFDQASTEVQLSGAAETATGPVEQQQPHFNSVENSSDVGASYQQQTVSETGIKTWASITGAVSASPVKKPQNDSRMQQNQQAPPPAQFQPMHSSGDNLVAAAPMQSKPPRNQGGNKNFHANESSLVSPPNEPRGSSDRRSGRGAGPSGNQQQPQMSIGTFPPKSESPGAKFQNQGGYSGPYNNRGPQMGGGGSFGPGSSQQLPDEWQIFVGNLPNDVTNDELRRRFSEYGNVEDVRISRGSSVPFGFVAFDNAAPAQKILGITQGPERQTLFLRNEKHRINVEEKKPRGVGGGGGRSGGGRFGGSGGPGGPPGGKSGSREGSGSNNKFFKSGPGPQGSGGPGKGGPSGNKGGAQNSNNSNANYINNSQQQNSFQQGPGGGRR